MARDRANINTGIWTDDDFIDLPNGQQWLYFLLMTDPELSYSGVADWRPERIAQRSSTTTKEDIEKLGAELQNGRYIFIDKETEEVLVRSFLRHDGLLKQPRLGVSVFNAYGSIASKDIRKVVIHELKKLYSEYPDWKAFGVEKMQELLKLSSADMAEFTPGLGDRFGDRFTPGLGPNVTQPYVMHTATATATATSKDEESNFSEEKIRPDVEQIIERLETHCEKHGFKKPNRTKANLNAARLLIDNDQKPVEQIISIIGWVSSNDFWPDKIRSVTKLREKFDQLEFQSEPKQAPTPQALNANPQNWHQPAPWL